MVVTFTSDKTTSERTNSQRLVNMGSSDYLGLSTNPSVIEGASAALRKYGLGFSMNQPFATTDLHILLRHKLSSYLGTDDALLFSSCTAANIALITALHLITDKYIAMDAGCHPSSNDGCMLGGNRVIRYKSRDVDNLVQQMSDVQENQLAAIITDGIFSIDGAIAHIDEIVPVANSSGSVLVIDESHSAGIVGMRGLGCCAHFQLEMKQTPVVLTGTFAKAFGSGGGGYIAGPKDLLDEVKRLARFYMFNTGMHIAAVGGAVAALDLALGDSTSRTALHRTVQHLRGALAAAGFELSSPPGAITSIPIGDAENAKRIGNILHESGYIVTVVAPPIVQSQLSSIRIQCSSTHAASEIDELCEMLARWRRESPS